MNINEFIKVNNITMAVNQAEENPNNKEWKDADHWKCVLKNGKKRMTIYFSKGYGHNGAEPMINEVLECICMDYQYKDTSFHNFCWEFGYDEDSRKAEKDYKSCIKESKKADIFFGELMNDLLNCEND